MAIATAGILGPADGVMAQTASGADPAGGESGIADIVVTARRRTERLQNVPVAITALTSRDLQNRSVNDAIGLAGIAPNLSSTKGFSGGSQASFFIRGVGQVDQSSTTDPGVAVYIDGVYYGRTNGADVATLDVERVEVLRGPQGTLFGKNALGGAISIITAQPTDKAEGSITLIGGSRKRAELRSWLSGPLADNLSARVSFNAKTQDGYGHRLNDNHRFGDIRTISTRGQVRWDATDRARFDVRGDYLRTRGNGSMVKLAGDGPLPSLPAGYGANIPTQRFRTNSNYDPGNALDVWGGSITGSLGFGENVEAKSITAYRGFRQKTGNDFDGGPQSLVDEGFFTKQHQFSQELQLSGKSFGDRLNWVVGGYYFKENIDQSVTLFAFTPTALNQVARYHIENLSGFTQATLKLSDSLSITAGARYTHERKGQTSEVFFLNSFNAFYALTIDQAINTPASLRGFVVQAPTTFSNTWNSFTPKLSVETKISEDVLTYVSYSKGFKSGGFNSRESGFSSFAAYDPETLDSYEVGLKTDLFDRRLRFNVAAFYGDYKNVQLYVLRVTGDGALVIETQNAGKARIYGLEAEAVLRPNRSLELSASLGYLDTKYRTLSAAAIANGVELDDPFPQAPKWTANLSAQYTFYLPTDQRLTAHVDFNYKSKFAFFAANNPLDRQRGYGLLNSRLSYDSGRGWTAAVFVSNVTDKKYSFFKEDVRNSFDVALDWPAEPRTFGVELGYRF
ncbi:MAG: TonB-dependent receptor [Sphingomonadaceae bacterium]